MSLLSKILKPNIANMKRQKDIAGLIKALKFPQAEIHTQAAEALAAVGDASAVEALCSLLDDHNVSRRSVILGLGRIGDVRAVAPLLARIPGWGKWDLHGYALQALGQIGDPRALEVLMAGLHTYESQIHDNAKLGLAAMKEKALPALLPALRDPEVWHEAAALVEPFSSSLALEDRAWWLAAKGDFAGALGSGSLALEPLVTALNDRNPNVYVAAAQALGRLGDVRAVEPLVENLRKNRYEARNALRVFGPAATQALLPHLGDPERSMRISVIEALGQTGDPDAVPPLITALEDPEESVGYFAALALGELGDARAVDPLIHALRSPGIQEAASRGLGLLGEKAPGRLISALQDPDGTVRQGIARALGLIQDPGAVPALIQAMGDGDSGVRAAAAASLVASGDERADPVILQAMKDDKPVRLAVTKAICDSPNTRYQQALALGISDPDHEVKTHAALALARLPDARLIPELIQVLGSAVTEWDDRAECGVTRPDALSDAARDALIAIGAPAVQPLLEALHAPEDKDTFLLQVGAEVLGSIGDAQAVPALQALTAHRNDPVAYQAKQAIASIQRRAADANKNF
jgi:HEAT repeat protein